MLFWVRPTLFEYLAGLVAVLLGVAVRTWGAGHLVKTTSLTISGPYARMRHPLYVGTLLCGSGIAVMLGGAWALGVLAVFLPWFFLVYFPRKERLESERSMVRYIAWAIPSIGFIGTVRGIGEALAQAHKAVEGDITGVTMSLGVAFNSTLIALLLSIILMLIVHQIQLQQQRLVLDAEHYADEHLIRHLRVQ